jgi:hypothetical protein
MIIRQGEAPDFGIQIGNRDIGLEITEIFLPAEQGQTALRERESITSCIVNSAKRDYERRGHPPLYVSVAFFSGPDIRRVRRDHTARALADLVSELPKSLDGHISWSNKFDGPDELNIVAFISILPVPENSLAHWNVAQAGWVAPQAEGLIRLSILAKNNILPTYKRKYGENWLLVTIDGRDPSQFFDLQKLSSPLVVPHDFDKAYLFRRFPVQVIPIHSTVPPNL